MTRVVFDTNIYDQLSLRPDLQEKVRQAIEAGKLLVIVPSTVREQLLSSPFGDVPTWFPTLEGADSVFVLGSARLGYARLGEGEVYTHHRGTSHSAGNVRDAIIADTAVSDADLLVSEDRRCRERLATQNTRCRALTLSEFEEQLALL